MSLMTSLPLSPVAAQVTLWEIAGRNAAPCSLGGSMTSRTLARIAVAAGAALFATVAAASPALADVTGVPKNLQVHLIVDNYGTHTHDNVKAWLAKHPRFHLHFTPTSSSWLNLVERWFRELTNKAIRRGVFRSVPELIAAIDEYLQAHNDDPKPFVWTATAESILDKVRRGRVTLEQVTNQN